MSSLKNLSTRRGLLTAATITLLAYWLVLLAASASMPLHQWLHGGSTPQDDDCAVVLLAAGKVSPAQVATVAVIASFVAIYLIEIFSFPFLFKLPLPPGRGPPSASFFPLR